MLAKVFVLNTSTMDFSSPNWFNFKTQEADLKLPHIVNTKKANEFFIVIFGFLAMTNGKVVTHMLEGCRPKFQSIGLKDEKHGALNLSQKGRIWSKGCHSLI